MAPVAGLLIGALGAAVLLVATLAGLSPLTAAALALAALLSITGALHEDGLADCADGFGGGQTRARKLEIMRDSRIGTFGASALVLSILLRVAALADVTGHAASSGAIALIVAAVLSRTLCLLPLVLLPPARPDGLGAASANVSARRLVQAFAVAAALTFAAALVGSTLARLAAATLIALAAVLGLCALAWRQIGGQTGDVAGAAQQIAEIAVLLTFAAAAG